MSGVAKRMMAMPHQLGVMDTQTMYVPVSVLLKVDRIKELTDSAEAVAAAVSASPKLVLDAQNNRARPNHTVKRNTIILREVPEGSTEKDVRAIFDGLGEWRACVRVARVCVWCVCACVRVCVCACGACVCACVRACVACLASCARVCWRANALRACV